jgi:2-keto-4-pentenoate hydratase/2-oxohepta-3-ene-1,7-dioic acid hydratase in catechol pathway
MKWMRFRRAGNEGFGRVDREEVVVYDGELFGANRPTGERVALADVEWLVPCQPGKIVGLWNNFYALAAKNGWGRPAEPLYFLKAPGSALPHHGVIPSAPSELGRVFYEGELAIVIGRTARAVGVDAAREYIFGYACANDVTAGEVIDRDASFAQWARAKGRDGFGPFGPVIETDFDWHGAPVRTRVGGRERQNFPLADMIFAPHEIVARLSNDFTLEPGDLILCGTSLGALPMKPGTAVEVEIDGIGVLANRYG